MQYNYIVKPRAYQKIWSFYRNVAKKYKHVYAAEDMIKNVQEAVRSINRIEKSLLRRRPTINRWKNWHMAHSGNWYYAYTIEGDTVVVKDACHAQNMHEDSGK